jgi:uncharacterized protein (TIGR01777 family)
MRVAVSGSSGFVGTALVDSLTADGHEVVRLVRRPPRAADEVTWDVRKAGGGVDPQALGAVDAIVNLAGAGIGDKRWTDSYKRTLHDSHVAAARAAAELAVAAQPRPGLLVSVGAMGYYGLDNGGGPLTEDSPAGTDFAARIIVDKEAATQPAADAGIRVVLPRLALVMDASGSTLGRRLLPLGKAGLLGPLAGGKSVWSVVSLDDVVRALRFLLDQEDASGPYNVSAPVTTTNGEFTRLLGKAIHRPTIAPVPKFALRIVLGDFADDVLGSFAVVPKRLTDAGFAFADKDAAAVIDSALSSA